MSKRTGQGDGMRLLKLWIRMPRKLRYLAIIVSLAVLHWFFKWLNG
ncbi:hypothetical protein ABEX47_10815 [Paenibacillus ehimensis]|nr:hypothetical protein [Paenibacillus ehimensis]MEC0209079.1 hypothetical protein [Paenibacillus ehimensis]